MIGTQKGGTGNPSSLFLLRLTDARCRAIREGKQGGLDCDNESRVELIRLSFLQGVSV
jgi:hypothetical protein